MNFDEQKSLKIREQRLATAQCFRKDNVPNTLEIINHFLKQGTLETEDAILICREAAAVLRKEPNILYLSGKYNIVGDIHGQFYDLAQVFTIGGDFSIEKYVFLGNYVGNGQFSCECFLALLAAKLEFPSQIFLLRGNNESRFMTTSFGFDKECSLKYSKELYTTVIEAFNCLPLVAVVNTKYFCVHGGLSPDVSRVEDIRHIHRFREVPSVGAMCDLLWSDPYWDVENPILGNSAETEYYTPVNVPFDMEATFFDNEQRGRSYIFNFACVKHFVNVNGLWTVLRSHEIQDEGYCLHRAHPNNNFPVMLSVFSAPNYCDAFENKGAFLRLSEETIEIKQFAGSPHPFVLPGLNAFTWSFPFFADSVVSFFNIMLEDKISSASEN